MSSERWCGLGCGCSLERGERERARGERGSTYPEGEGERGERGSTYPQGEGEREGRARKHIPAGFKWSSHREVLRFKMVSCDVDCVFDLRFEGLVLFSGVENLARSHFRNINSQQKVGKPKQRDCKDYFLHPCRNFFFFLSCVFLLRRLPRLALHLDGLLFIIGPARTRLVSTAVRPARFCADSVRTEREIILNLLLNREKIENLHTHADAHTRPHNSV